MEKSYWQLWSLYWPLLLIAGGLPTLVAPKDGVDQVFGLLLTCIGVFLQLQKPGLFPWSLAQTWPILLMLARLLLVTQALVRKDGDPGGSSSPTS